MKQYPHAIEQVINWFSRLPGIGYKSAERMAMKLLEMNSDDVHLFANSMICMKDQIRNCSKCNGISDTAICGICSNPNRDHSLLCVVEQSKDMFAIERGGGYSGIYFVLGGKLSPINGVGPDELAFDLLSKVVESGGFAEAILATGSDVEGEATAIYTQRMIKAKIPKVTRIAYGVPVGSSLDFADEMTLMRAIDGRRDY